VSLDAALDVLRNGRSVQNQEADFFLVDSFADSNRDGFWRISTEYMDVELT
jgi:hypothetical protein